MQASSSNEDSWALSPLKKFSSNSQLQDAPKAGNKFSSAQGSDNDNDIDSLVQEELQKHQNDMMEDDIEE